MPAAPRATCGRCLRPALTCICHWIRPTASAVEVLILQHPMELTQAKGSARLLHLSLQPSRLSVGETFAEADLQAWFQTERGGVALLYPQTDALPAPESAVAAQPSDVRCLVVLDATWRKSLRMLHLNPCLRALPRLALQAPPPSRYGAIRRARRSDQLSTLEATCLALQQLGAAPLAELEPLLRAFDGFVVEQAARVPPR